MKVSQREQRFLQRRRQLLRAWSIAGPLLLVVLIVLCVWLFLAFPLMFNPFEVVTRLEAGSLQPATLQLMALFLPLAMLMLLFIVLVILLLVFSALANDRKYLAIIDRCQADDDGKGGTAGHEPAAGS